MIGKWVVEATSVRDAAFNITMRQAEKVGLRLSDSEIIEKMGPFVDVLVKDPPEYILKKDGKYTFRTSKEITEGTWKLDGDELTFMDKGDSRGARLKVADGLLTYIPEIERRRKIELVRK